MSVFHLFETFLAFRLCLWLRKYNILKKYCRLTNPTQILMRKVSKLVIDLAKSLMQIISVSRVMKSSEQKAKLMNFFLVSGEEYIFLPAELEKKNLLLWKEKIVHQHRRRRDGGQEVIPACQKMTAQIKNRFRNRSDSREQRRQPPQPRSFPGGTSGEASKSFYRSSLHCSGLFLCILNAN